MQHSAITKKRTSVTLFVYPLLFVISILFQIVFFHYQAFHSVLVSSVHSNPVAFWSFYLPKIGLAIIICSFSFLFVKIGWTIVFSFLLNIWCLAELVYYRVNSIFFDTFSFTMVGNMNGFWNSIISFIHSTDILFFISTIVLAAFSLWLPRHIVYIQRQRLSSFFIVAISGILIHVGGSFALKEKYRQTENRNTVIRFNPFSEQSAQDFWGPTSLSYIKQTSVVHALFYNAINLMKFPFIKKTSQISLTAQEQNEIHFFFNSLPSASIPPKPNGNLIIILFESLENWAIDPIITPHIYNSIKNSNNCLWAKKVIRQTKGGTSADGQMIVNTGLLPISEGAACFRYPTNKYPSISELYDKSAIIVPGDLSVWNQKRMNDAYQIDTAFVVSSSLDSETMETLSRVRNDYPFILALSIASHTPFLRHAKSNPVEVDEDLPSLLKNYINCVHYTDACIQGILDLDMTESLENKTTVVITGDHTIFDAETRNQFYGYAQKNNSVFQDFEEYCPFIVFSPFIHERTIIDTPVYQMDIFPTIMNLIGCGDYYWKGFGRDLINTNTQSSIDIDRAYVLSDLIFKTDYFNTIANQTDY